MESALFSPARWTAVAAVVALTLGVSGGCPVAQTPNVPPADEETQDQPLTPTQQGEDEIPRPIPPVTGGETATSPPGTTTGISEPPPTTGGGTGGTGGGQQGVLLLSLNAPNAAVRTRPGGRIDVTFSLTDPSTVRDTVELIVARDDDQNGAADGAAITSEPIPLTAVHEGTNTYVFNTNSLASKGLLLDQFGSFVLGVRVSGRAGEQAQAYAPGVVIVDGQAPEVQWVNPTSDALVNRDTPWTIQFRTRDNSPHTADVLLDPDANPNNGNEFQLVGDLSLAKPADSSALILRTVSASLAAVPPGTYNYVVRVSDGIPPEASTQGTNPGGGLVRIAVTNRLIGEFDLNNLVDSSRGAILQGFNFNDLAGSSMAAVPDIDGDGDDELIVVSRFGKPYVIERDGVGFGEAYLIYGNRQARLRGIQRLNSVGLGNVPGLVFAGIRNPLNQRWTRGLSDVTVIPDMDGDSLPNGQPLPELVFSFPRVESINLGDEDPGVQHPELFPDLSGMGNLEYNANLTGTWTPNTAQFARGGVVIVSSHNAILSNPGVLNRKFDRVLDLHEVGQMFTGMSPPRLQWYVWGVVPDLNDPFGCEDCILCTNCSPIDPCMPVDNDGDGEPDEPEPPEAFDECDGITDNCDESRYERYYVVWDAVFNNQGPGGFHQPWTLPAADPPLANPMPWTLIPPDFFYPPAARCDDLDLDGTPDGCEYENAYLGWGFCPSGRPFPCTNPAFTCGIPTWNIGPSSVWTGFYGPSVRPLTPTSVGARILGQAVDDQFGAAVAADGNFLYVSAPQHTAAVADVPELPEGSGQRVRSGVVYQLRTNAGSPTRTQLWIEPGTRQIPGENPDDPPIDVPLEYPFLDAELPNRQDYTLPVPHQYIIETVGSLRGFSSVFEPPENEPDTVRYPFPAPDSSLDYEPCPPPFENAAADGAQADACSGYTPYPVGTSGFYVDRVNQIVGPHRDAQVSNVRALGDINNDGLRDFAVGSANIRLEFGNANSPTVGGIFIVYSRPTGLEGDYLLEQLALDPSDVSRVDGVYIHGASAGETLGRNFADAGDVNGDGLADVIIGNELKDVSAGGPPITNAGEAIVLLGSPALVSPAGGWTSETIPAGNVIRFVGSSIDELVGANVASAGDMDADGFDDLLIAAPGADGGSGAVYLVYGGTHLDGLPQPIRLAEKIGTVDLPGVKFLGRRPGDYVGGHPVGGLNVDGIDPANNSAQVFSQGVAPLGDIDGDGNADFAISAMLADPDNTTDAGEVYILYGKRGD